MTIALALYSAVAPSPTPLLDAISVSNPDLELEQPCGVTSAWIMEIGRGTIVGSG